MKIFFGILFTLLFEYSYQAGEWSYLGEDEWPGLCLTGKKQSPIDINTNAAVLDKFEKHIRGPLALRGYDNVQVKAINNGHTLKWAVLDAATAPVLSGGPLKGNYTLLQFHLHWLSEHTINGYKYPLEIHLVHKKFGISIEEALTRDDGLAVLGILGQVHGEEHSGDSFEELEQNMDDLYSPTPVGEGFNVTINITRIFSPRMQSFYTYAGSLTTPECNEVVTWIVMDVPMTISDLQFKMISKVDIGGVSNYRSLQPQNDRTVYRSIASCASVFLPGLMTVIPTAMVLLKCTLGVIGKGVKNTLCPIINIKRKILGETTEECV